MPSSVHAGPCTEPPATDRQTDRGHSPIVEAVREATDQEMARDPSVVLFGLDVDDPKAIQGTTRGLAGEVRPGRVFGTPLSEDAMTGVAIGMALAGLRPIHVHIRMDFLMLAMNQLVNVAAKSRYMYGGRASVPLVVRSMIGKSWGQGAQHSQGLYSFFMHVPGLKVVAPVHAVRRQGLPDRRHPRRRPGAVRRASHAAFSEWAGPRGAYTVAARQGADHGGRRRRDARRHLAHADGVPARPAATWRRSASGPRSSTRSGSARSTWTRSPPRSEKTGRLLVVDNGWTTLRRRRRDRGPGRGAAEGVRDLRVSRLGFAPSTCPTTPSLEALFYPNARTIAAAARDLVEGAEPAGCPRRIRTCKASNSRGRSDATPPRPRHEPASTGR